MLRKTLLGILMLALLAITVIGVSPLTGKPFELVNANISVKRGARVVAL